MQRTGSRHYIKLVSAEGASERRDAVDVWAEADSFGVAHRSLSLSREALAELGRIQALETVLGSSTQHWPGRSARVTTDGGCQRELLA